MQSQPFKPRPLCDHDAEQAVFTAILRDQYGIESVPFGADGFYFTHHQTLFAVMRQLWDEQCPISPGLIVIELDRQKKLADVLPEDRRPKGDQPLRPIVAAYLEELKAGDVAPEHIKHYVDAVGEWANRRAMAVKLAEGLKKLYDLAPLEEIASSMSEAVLAGNGSDRSAVIEWKDSIDRYEAILNERERLAKLPPEQQKIFDFPWEKWNAYIMSLTPGSLLLFAAPTNVGKSIYAENVSEHWARRGHNVLEFHLELDEEDMTDRRTARWTGIHRPTLMSGKMGQADRKQVRDANVTLKQWRGGVHYIDASGWTVDQIIREVRAYHKAGKCDAVVIDYLQKIRGSDKQWRQLRDQHKIEADNMEIIKIALQRMKLRGFVVSQMTKDAADLPIEQLTSSKVRGAGELMEKSNVAILATRKRGEDGTHSKEIGVKIEKNKGEKLIFTQVVNGPLYTIHDH